jgi:hypothetical protein
MYRFVFILAALSFLLLPGVASAQEVGQGVIEGKVINGTEGGGEVAGVQVALITYIGDTVDANRTVLTDGEGNFRFDNVAPEYRHLVSARYMDVYYYNQVVFEEGQTTTYIEVGVCDTTDSDKFIKATISHIIINVGEDAIKVTEMFLLVNDGDRTYAGTDGSLIFTLPEGASEIIAPDELMPDFELLSDNRLAYLVPFPPGQRQIVFSYNMPEPESDNFILPLKVDYPADSFSLLVGGQDIEVVASPLVPAGPVTTDTGEQLLHFQGESLARDTLLNVGISGPSGSGGRAFIVLWAAIALVIIAAGCFMIIRKRVNRTDE